MIKVLMIGGPAAGKVLAVDDKHVRIIRVAPLPRVDHFDVQPHTPFVPSVVDPVITYHIKTIPCGDGRAYYVASQSGTDPVESLVDFYRNSLGDPFDTIEPSPI